MVAPMSDTNAAAPAQGSLEADKALVERIAYLGTLASDRSKIDPMMETLRIVTARWNSAQPLGDQERLALDALEKRLKDYLVNRDPLRSFTPQMLDSRLVGHSSAHDLISDRNSRNFLTAILLATVAAITTFALSLFAVQIVSSALLSIPIFFVVLHVGIAWFYLSALKGFRSEFRLAFIYICVGVVLFSLGFSQYAVITLFDVNHPIFWYGGLPTTIASAFVFIYAGLVQYARLLNLRSWFTFLPVTIPLVLLVGLIAVVVPHAGKPAVEWYFDLSLASVWLLTLFCFLGMGAAHGIAKGVTPAYATQMTWMYRYLLLCFLGSLIATILLPAWGELRGQALNIIIAIGGIGPQLLLLYTGYLFKRETGR
jgi:hypothetical protein